MIVLAALISELPAQNTDDALRYSQTITGGTALSQGMGGAMGAVGADFSSVSINPAGIGLYRMSEFAGSLSLFNASGSSNYYGSGSDDRKFNFNIPNLHLVIHSPSYNRLKTKGWLSTTFAIGYNKQSNLSERWSFKGQNPDNSVVNQFILDAGNASPDNLNPFGSALAYQTYLIDPDQTAGSGYTSIYGPLNGGMTQRGLIEARGRAGETNIAFAGNYSNRLYVGGSLAIRRIVYEREYTYTEKNETDSVPGFNDLEYRQFLNDRATSIAFRAGAIYRVNDFLRLGVAALLPLDYTVRTEFSSEMSSSLATGDFYYASPDGEYRYKLRNPARYTLSAAFVYKKLGLLSVDYEMVNYSKLRLVDDADSYAGFNDQIRDGFRNSGNLRIGLEGRFNDLYARGGVQMIGTPYENSAFGKGYQVYSLGGGYRNGDFFMDVSYSFSGKDILYFPYSAPGLDVQPARTNVRNNNIVFSIGTRF